MIPIKHLEHYPGSSDVNGVYQLHINNIPPHSIYVEPFLGKGTILRRIRPAVVSIGNDIDAAVISLWRASAPYWIRLLNIPAVQLLSSLSMLDSHCFVYCDPPYPQFVCSSDVPIYKYIMSDDQHKHFLSMALTAPYNCMIKMYPNDMYDSALSDWRKIPYRVTTRGSTKTECIYMNYAKPSALHDYSFIGADCWDRQRIKRKIDRWTSNLAKLPELERQAILQALSAIS